VAIRKVQRKKGTSYVVTWRDEGRRQYSRSFDRRKDADAFEAKVTLHERRGELDDLDAGKQRLRDFVAEWWRIEAEPHLTPKTLQLYASSRRRHILPRLGDVELRKLTPEMIGGFQAQLVAEGVGSPTVRKVMVFLQGVLERAVAWRRISSNPVRPVKRRPQTRQRTIRPPGPEEIERLRAHLLRQGRERDVRDATLVSVLAYAGLRPGEALALTWGDIRDSTILVDKALALGQVKDTKTRRTRAVRLLKPLVADLAQWRMASGRPGAEALFFPTPSGKPWSQHDWQNWRNRVYVPAAAAVGINSTRPYDLRHACSSLMLAEGRRNPVEIAAQLGHSPGMTLQQYGHLIDELQDRPSVPAEQLIREARERVAAQWLHKTAEAAGGA